MQPRFVAILLLPIALATACRRSNVLEFGSDMTGVTEAAPVTKLNYVCPIEIGPEGEIGVWFSVVVEADGSLNDIKVYGLNDDKDKNKRYGCEREAVQALKQWQSRPALKDGVPVAIRTRIGVSLPVIASQ